MLKNRIQCVSSEGVRGQASWTCRLAILGLRFQPNRKFGRHRLGSADRGHNAYFFSSATQALILASSPSKAFLQSSAVAGGGAAANTGSIIAANKETNKAIANFFIT